MSSQDIIRAWKDVSYRNSLSEAQQAQLPAHPAGTVEVDASKLAQPSYRNGPSEFSESGYPPSWPWMGC